MNEIDLTRCNLGDKLILRFKREAIYIEPKADTFNVHYVFYKGRIHKLKDDGTGVNKMSDPRWDVVKVIY